MNNLGTFIGQSFTHIRRGLIRFKINPPSVLKEGQTLTEIEHDYLKLCEKITNYVAESKGWGKEYTEMVKEDRVRFNFTYDILEPELKNMVDGEPRSSVHLVLEDKKS